MLDALNRSGYLLEQRVEQFFCNNRYHISNNNYFVDDGTNKLREIDLVAETSDGRLRSMNHDVTGTLTYKLICECENNPQPAVFFLSKGKYPEGGQGLFDVTIPHITLPDNASADEHYRWGESLLNSQNVFQEHHFFNMPFSTQYCSFLPKDQYKPEGKWIAKHLDEQHETFTNLMKGAAFISEKDAGHIKQYPTFYYGNYQVYLYYPVLILQNQLYTAQATADGVDLQECDHLVYWRNHKIENSEHLFGIDVIRESYLPTYLKLIEDEVEKMHVELLKNPYLQQSIDKWTEQQIEEKEVDSQEIQP